MKNINKIVMGSLLVILMMGCVLAIGMPAPISGRLVGNHVSGLEIEVTNLGTGTSVVTKTTSAGEWLVDWANTPDISVRNGNQIQVKVIGCDAIDCSKIVMYSGEPNLFVEMVVPIEKPCVQETSWTSIGASLTIGLIMGLVAFMGGGIKIYKNRLGKAVLQHKHKGIRGYHNANTSHTNTNYRHRRWKDNPKGCVDDVKKIEENGGLIW